MRHAEALPAKAGQLDADRNLSETGILEAEKIGEFLKQNYALPDCVILSPSTRTKQTASYLNVFKPANFIIADAIYDGGVKQYLDAIAEYDLFSSLLLIGHNPTIFALLQYFVSSNSKLKSPNNYPTAGLAVIDFPALYINSCEHSGQLIDFYYP